MGIEVTTLCRYCRAIYVTDIPEEEFWARALTPQIMCPTLKRAVDAHIASCPGIAKEQKIVLQTPTPGEMIRK